MKFSTAILCILLLACKDSGLKPEISTGNERHFENAKQIDPSWSKKNTIVCHIISDPDNLHPVNGLSLLRAEIFQYTQRCLMYVDFTNNSVIPGLVKSMPEISSDSLSYTYSLRENIRWDDGNSLTSDDVIFTGKVYKCPLSMNPSSRSYWKNVRNIIKKDDHTFTIIMFEKNFQNISFLTAFPVLQKSFYDGNGVLNSFTYDQFNSDDFKAAEDVKLVKWSDEFNSDANGRRPERLNGLGMYKVYEWQSGQYLTLVKKDHHWSDATGFFSEHSYPDRIIFQINKDEASQILAFRSQTLDVSSNISVNTLLQLKSDATFNKNYNTALLSTFNYTYLCFNEKPDSSRLPLFTDLRVRKAIASLTPVEDLIQIVYRDFSKQCQSQVSNVSRLKKDFNKNLKPLPYNPTLAQKLLHESGWTDSDGDGILDKIINGNKIDFIAELIYLNSSAEWKSMATYIAEMYGKSGIKINPVAAELKVFLEKARAHDFDLLLGAWNGTSLPEDFTQLWHSSSWSAHGSNYSGFGNENSDMLIEKMRTELNDSVRTMLSYKLQEIIYDDQPYVFLYSNMKRFIIHKRFGNQFIYSERPGILLNELQLLEVPFN